jgi:ABC-type transport system substrate-binding protein
MQQLSGGYTRRHVIQAAGIGALGLAGAALLGCGGGGTGAAGGGGGVQATAAPVTGVTGVEVLPLTAPVVKGTKKPGGTYTYPIGGSTWTEHDSHTQRAASEWHVISEKVTEADPIDAKTLPSIAESWEIASPTTLVFKIRKGVKIHNVAPWNGREFDATDVAWNLERIGGLYSDRLKIPLSAFQRASMVQNIQKAEATDKNTVKVTLSSPNSAFFAGISENRTMLMPKEMDDIGYKDPMKFGSMGPFQMGGIRKDQDETFDKFPGYFRPGEPSFDKAVLLAIPDVAGQIAAFATNQIQTIRATTSDMADQLRKTTPDALYYSWIDSNWHHIRPSMTYKPLQDLRVRKALHLATDYATLGNQEEGEGWGYQSCLSPGFQEAWKPEKVRKLPGYNPDTKTADRAEAKKLMEAAGYPNGQGIDMQMLFATVAGEPNAVAVIWQQQMMEVFPDLKMPFKAVDSGTFSRLQSQGDFNILSYTITAVPDPVLEMISQYRSDGSRNYGKFVNPDLDALVDKALLELNPKARTELLDQFQTKFENDWRPMYVMHANAARYVVQSNIGGYDKTAGTWFGYSWYTKIGRWFYVGK